MNSANATHPTREVLNAFGLGKLEDSVADLVNRHLENCPDCQRHVAGLSSDSLLNQLRAANGPVGTPPPGKSLSALSQAIKRQPAAPKDGATPSSDLDGVPPELANHPDYQIIRELGAGGMGVVYLAKHKVLDRLEVLKVLGAAMVGKPGALPRFLREIRNAAALSHENVVKAHSAFQLGERLVFAMEYVEGQDLADLVKAHGPLPVANACHYARQVALGLQHAHDKMNMVHRDIKPHNLILVREGKRHLVKILDFGLAKANSEKQVRTDLTGEGKMLGTPDYMAPEQILDAAAADIRADIYSLGCTLHYLLTGKPPFHAGSLFDLLLAHQSKTAAPVNLLRTDAPVELAAVIQKMMAKDPAKRYQKPAEVAQELSRFLKPGALTAPKNAQAALSLGERANAQPQEAAAVKERAETLTGATPGHRTQVPDAFDFAAEIAPRPCAEKNTVAVKGLKRKAWLWGAIAAVLLIPLGIWLGGIILRVPTPYGDLVIEINSNIARPEVLVDGKKVVIQWSDGGKKAEIRAKPGSVIELIKDGFTITSGGKLELTESGVRILTARFEPIAASAGTQKNIPREDGFVSLFNGKNFDGWEKRGGDKTNVSFVDGALRAQNDGPQGWVDELVTKDTDYTDFHFRCQLKIENVRRTMASIKFRVDPSPRIFGGMRGYVADVFGEGSTRGREVMMGLESRARASLELKAAAYSKPAGNSDWQDFEAIFQGNRIQYLLNRERVIDFIDEGRAFERGAIALTFDWDTTSWFRNVEVKRLPPSSKKENTTVRSRWIHQELTGDEFNERWEVFQHVKGKEWIESVTDHPAFMRFTYTETHRTNDFVELERGDKGNQIIVRLYNSHIEFGPATDRLTWKRAGKWIDPPAEAASTKTAPTTDGFVPLFNCKDRAGWEMPPENKGAWNVTNGELIGKGGGFGSPAVLATTRRDFRNYHLRMEVTGGSDNQHLIVLGSIQDSTINGYQIRLSRGDQTGGDSSRIGSFARQVDYKMGELISFIPAAKDVSIAPGKPYTVEALINESKVKVSVNGEVVADYEDATRRFQSGQIILFCRGDAEFRCRKIEIKELAASLSPKEPVVIEPKTVPPKSPISDPISEKLDKAKAEYDSAMDKICAALAAEFSRREKSARSQGKNKEVDRIQAERRAFDERGELAKDVAEFRSQILAARAKMATAYQTAIKDYTKASKDAQRISIESQLKEFENQGEALTVPTDSLQKGSVWTGTITQRWAPKFANQTKPVTMSITERSGKIFKARVDIDNGFNVRTLEGTLTDKGDIFVEAAKIVIKDGSGKKFDHRGKLQGALLTMSFQGISGENTKTNADYELKIVTQPVITPRIAPVGTHHLQLLVDADFKRSCEGFETGGDPSFRFVHANGQYQLAYKRGGLHWPSQPALHNLGLADFVCELDAQFAGNPQGAWGLGLIRHLPPNDHWTGIEINTVGQVAIHLYDKKDLLRTGTQVLRPPGQPNTLRVEVVGIKIRVFVNGQFIGDALNEGLLPCALTLYVAGQNVDVLVNRIRVWRPRRGGVPPPAPMEAPTYVADFRNPVTEFPADNSTCKYENDVLCLLPPMGSTVSAGQCPGMGANNFFAEVEGRVAAGDKASIALICGAKNGDGTWLEVRRDGFYRVYRVDGGKKTFLMVPWNDGWLPHKGLKTDGAMNTIGVAVNGRRGTAYFNGRWAGDFVDTAYSGGYFSLGAGGARAEFSRLQVWPLQKLDQSTAESLEAIRKGVSTAKTSYEVEVRTVRDELENAFARREMDAQKKGELKIIDQIKSERQAIQNTERLLDSTLAPIKAKLSAARKKIDAVYTDATKKLTTAGHVDEARELAKAHTEFKTTGLRGPVELEEMFQQGEVWLGTRTRKDPMKPGQSAEYKVIVTERKDSNFSADLYLGGRHDNGWILKGTVAGNRVEYWEYGKDKYKMKYEGTLQSGRIPLSFDGVDPGGVRAFGVADLRKQQ